MPSVSICIPTYNHGRYIEEALRSAQAQAYEDLEILVLDNASQDDTAAIVGRIASRDSRIRYMRHRENIGLAGNLTACIEFARGRYIKPLCADDSLEPDCVSVLARELDENPTVALVGCARTVTDANLSPLRVCRARAAPERIPGAEMIAECFFFGNRIGEPTAVMFRRAEASRGFNPTYTTLVDLEMWFHLLGLGDFAAVPQALCKFRSHAEQGTKSLERSGRTVEDRRRLFRDFSAPAGRSAGLFRKWLWDFRMAYSVARIEPVAGISAEGSRSETFFPQAFARLTYPTVKLMTILGLRLVWKVA